MDPKIVFNISFGGVIKLVSVDSNSSFENLLGHIVTKWPELGFRKFNAMCVVGEFSNICLDSQTDFESVLLFCEVSRARLVSVDVVLLSENCSLSDDSNESLNLSSDRIFSSVQKKSTQNLLQSEKSNVTYGVPAQTADEDCSRDDQYVVEGSLNGEVREQGQSLLSDGWSNLIKARSGELYHGTAAEFRDDLIKYSTKMGFMFVYVRNAVDLIHAVCCSNGSTECGWYIKATIHVVESAYSIQVSPEPHTCRKNKLNVMEAEKMSARIIGDLMIPNARNKPGLNGKDVIDAMKTSYGVDIPYSKARRAAECAKVKLYGQFSESYNDLKYYCHALKLTNPGSVAVVEMCNKSKRFERLFISLFASIKGFQFCPPLIFLDGTFLRGPFGGILLVAIAKDGNKGLFPLTFGVVSVENTENWSWFLTMIRCHISHPEKVSFLSDRNSGLMAAFVESIGEPVHYFCVFHLLANLKARFCGGVKKRYRVRYVQLFRECAYEPDPLKFYEKVKEFRAMGGKKSEEWLSQLPYNKWAISLSPYIKRYGELTSNAAESFNAWILPARSFPITKMVDYIRTKLSRWFVERRNESNSWTGTLVPNKEALWMNFSKMGLVWNILLCPGNDYEVLSYPSTRVDLVSRSCSCHQWQSLGFPCCHATAVIRKFRVDLFSDVESYFLTGNYKQTYGWDINPVPETLLIELQSTPVYPQILCPLIRRPVGRPKLKKMIPSVGEYNKQQSREKICQKCRKRARHDEWSCAGC